MRLQGWPSQPNDCCRVSSPTLTFSFVIFPRYCLLTFTRKSPPSLLCDLDFLLLLLRPSFPMSFEDLSPSELRSSVIIQAWLEDVQLAISDSNRRKRSSSCPSQSGTWIVLGSPRGNIIASPKRQADDSLEGTGTPKHHQVFIHSDETPRARPAGRYSIANYPPLDPTRQLSSASSDDLVRSSTTPRSRSSSPIKNLGALRMTENPVEDSEELSEMPSSGRDLYKALARCRNSQGLFPSALRVLIIIKGPAPI